METIVLEKYTYTNFVNDHVLERIERNENIPIMQLRKSAQRMVEKIVDPEKRYVNRIAVYLATKYIYASMYYANLELPLDIESAYDLLHEFGLLDFMRGEQMDLFEQFVDCQVDEYEIEHSLEEESRRNIMEATENIKKMTGSVLNTIDRIDPNVIIRFIAPSFERIAKKLENTIPNLKN